LLLCRTQRIHPSWHSPRDLRLPSAAAQFRQFGRQSGNG